MDISISHFFGDQPEYLNLQQKCYLHQAIFILVCTTTTFLGKIMVQELMVCHINSQITRGVFVSTQLSSTFVEILLPYLITQNRNSREL